MRKANYISFIFGSLGILVLILDGQRASAGIQEGIELCLHTLIPALFPFIVLTSLIIGSLAGRSLRIFRWFCRLCHMTGGAESFLLVGILGGYPVGAGNLAAEVHRGRLTEAEANRLCIFCNNAGPSFLFGVLGPMFPDLGWIWIMWGIQITASLLTGHLLAGETQPGKQPSDTGTVTVSAALKQAISSMSLICGWVILFRMILNFMKHWFLWMLPAWAQAVVTGFLELSNGCFALSVIENHGLRFILAGIMLSLGGICVWMQTQAVFPELDLLRYVRGKILHCFICIVLSVFVIPFLSGTGPALPLQMMLPLCLGGIYFLLSLRKRKKAVAF